MLVPFDTPGRASLRKYLDVAIENDHIWPAFQPIIAIRSGGLMGFEVLTRWTDPEAGDIYPSTFIPALEKQDLIDRLFNHIVRLACPAAAAWPGHFFLAFNLSPKLLIKTNVAREIAELVEATRFPLDRFQVEVTEGSLISDDDRAYACLRDLDAVGIKVAIDDFGTGYSSLARLEDFPFRKLKIDGRFVRTLDREASKRRIVAAVVGLGQSLGITVVAEGVETEDEETVLRDLGCDLGQGWLYGKPSPAQQARHMLDVFATTGNEISPPLDKSPFQQLHQLNALYRQAPIGICFLDLSYRHVRANDRFASIHNMTGAELEGRSISDIMSGTTLSAAKRILLESAIHDDPVSESFIVGNRHIRVFCTRVVDLAGDVIGFSVVSADTPTTSERCRRLMDVSTISSVPPPPLRVCRGCSTAWEFH